MKRLSVFFVSLFLIFGLFSCSNETIDQGNSTKKSDTSKNNSLNENKVALKHFIELFYSGDIDANKYTTKDYYDKIEKNLANFNILYKEATRSESWKYDFSNINYEYVEDLNDESIYKVMGKYYIVFEINNKENRLPFKIDEYYSLIKDSDGSSKVKEKKRLALNVGIFSDSKDSNAYTPPEVRKEQEEKKKKEEEAKAKIKLLNEKKVALATEMLKYITSMEPLAKEIAEKSKRISRDNTLRKFFNSLNYSEKKSHESILKNADYYNKMISEFENVVKLSYDTASTLEKEIRRIAGNIDEEYKAANDDLERSFLQIRSGNLSEIALDYSKQNEKLKEKISKTFNETVKVRYFKEEMSLSSPHKFENLLVQDTSSNDENVVRCLVARDLMYYLNSCCLSGIVGSIDYDKMKLKMIISK
jgi:hypothetical protein